MGWYMFFMFVSLKFPRWHHL